MEVQQVQVKRSMGSAAASLEYALSSSVGGLSKALSHEEATCQESRMMPAINSASTQTLLLTASPTA